jgi:hypothetical protein
MFRNHLASILNRRLELYRLSGLIDWELFARKFGNLPEEELPGIPIRLMVASSS